MNMSELSQKMRKKYIHDILINAITGCYANTLYKKYADKYDVSNYYIDRLAKDFGLEEDEVKEALAWYNRNVEDKRAIMKQKTEVTLRLTEDTKFFLEEKMKEFDVTIEKLIYIASDNLRNAKKETNAINGEALGFYYNFIKKYPSIEYYELEQAFVKAYEKRYEKLIDFHQALYSAEKIKEKREEERKEAEKEILSNIEKTNKLLVKINKKYGTDFKLTS